MDDKKKKVGWSIGITSILGVLYSIDPVHFISYVNEALGHQLVQFSLVFALAAYVHRKGMKKDMGTVTEAINNLATALRADLTSLGGRIGVVEETIKITNSRLMDLEKPKE